MARLRPRTRLLLLLAAFGLGPLLLLPVLGLPAGPLLWLAPLVLLAAYLVASLTARPHEELVDTAERLRSGDLKARAVMEPGSDWAILGGALFDLADQLDRVTRTLEEQVADRTSALQRKADQLRAVGQVGRQVAAVLEPEQLLHFVVRVMRGTFGYDVAAVLQKHGEHLVLAACAARGIEEVPTGRVFPADSPATTPVVNGLAVQTALAVPMRLGDRVLGLLVVQSLQPEAFDEEDHFTVQTIAGQVAVALENARLLEAERQLRSLSVTEERNRMAREIHDTLAQGFMGIIMQLRAMHGAADPETARVHREQAEALARESLQEARRSVWNLRPATLEAGGLAGAIADELERLERRAALSTHLDVAGQTDRLSPNAETALLRVTQEALHNTVKYARASRVTVQLTITDEAAELTVADDGVGFDATRPLSPGTGGGFGLPSMAERAQALGGTFCLATAPGEGCRISVRIPINSSRRP